MKRCPACQCVYIDEELNFCRVDGAVLIDLSSGHYASTTVDLSASRTGAQTSHQLIQGFPSIAVLPFVNMSDDKENEYFCDGLAEELLNSLAKIEELKVAARTSAFFFKGKNLNIDEIGETLNVSTVLEGSVRKSGKRLRITAQLINVSDGYHLWSERYDRQMEDVFDIQDEITLAIVDALKVKLLGEEKAALLKRYTGDTEAYELYLRGRYYLNKYTVEGWNKTVEYFEKAIEKDAEYALAHAGIALCRNIFWYYGFLPPREIVPAWKAATNRALEIDSELSEAHLSLANIKFFYEWNWKEAEQAYKRAIKFNPNNPDAHQFYGLFLATRERFDEAISEARRAIELDPLSLFVNLHVGWIYWHAGRLDYALKQAQKMFEIEPDFNGAHWLMASIYMAKGLYEEGIEACQKSLAAGGNQIAAGTLGSLYGIVGKREEAMRVLNELLERAKDQYVAAMNIARVYSGLGETDQAIEWLEKAYEERNGQMVLLKVATMIGTGNAMGESLRKDPRFLDLLRRMELAA